MIWFTSDTHFAHKNICASTTVWNDKSGCRDFPGLREMNQALVKNINECVQQEDTLYFLGDWSFGGYENVYNFWDQIICKDIYFIPGNHDQHIKKNKPLSVKDKTIFSTQQLFKMLPELTSITYEKKKFILCHYPLDQWEDMDRGAIHLHGHCHGKINDCETNQKYKRMDIGIDWKEFRPYSIDEIVEIMNKRKIKAHATK